MEPSLISGREVGVKPAPVASRTTLLVETVRLLQMAMDAAQRAGVETVAAHGLTELHCRALRFLDCSGPAAMRELAHHLKNDPASVTALVDRLEQRNLVERRSDPCDRRIRRLALTPEGEATCSDMREEFAAASPAHVLSVAQLQDLRDLLVAMVGEVPAMPCPG